MRFIFKAWRPFLISQLSEVFFTSEIALFLLRVYLSNWIQVENYMNRGIFSFDVRMSLIFFLFFENYFAHLDLQGHNSIIANFEILTYRAILVM